MERMRSPFASTTPGSWRRRQLISSKLRQTSFTPGAWALSFADTAPWQTCKDSLGTLRAPSADPMGLSLITRSKFTTRSKIVPAAEDARSRGFQDVWDLICRSGSIFNRRIKARVPIKAKIDPRSPRFGVASNQSGGETIDRRAQHLDVERFAEHAVHVQSFVGFADFRRKVRRDDNDFAGDPAFPDFTDQFYAGEVRHLLIDNDDIKWIRVTIEPGQGRIAIIYSSDVIARPVKDIAQRKCD